MGADPIIYCLEHVTDYEQFERLCDDLMSREGFPDIEPLGGTKDKGRDAIHISRADLNDVTIFAYSVREDWRKKLEQDSHKVRDHGHACKRLMFLCTATYTPTERDEAVSFVQNTFGWRLELYGLERLRVLLANRHRTVTSNHPQIFCAPFFRQEAPAANTAREFVVVDDAEPDAALASWLGRRLTLEGYRVWSRHLSPIAGTSVADVMRDLIRTRAARVISIISPSALDDADVSARRVLAANDNLLLPIITAPVPLERLDRTTAGLAPIDFAPSWATGLGQLLTSLDTAGCPRSKPGADAVALRSFLPTSVISLDPEPLLSNCFPVLTLPAAICEYRAAQPVPEKDRYRAQFKWAFRWLDAQRFVAFTEPPEEFETEHKLQLEEDLAWADCTTIGGIPVEHLLSELIRKSLTVAALRRGLKYCSENRLTYFPKGLFKSNRLSYKRPDGRTSNIKVVGERLFRPGASASTYRYHIAPTFSVQRQAGSSYIVCTRIRVRFTDTQGNLLSSSRVNSRRKHLCKTWWNDDWLARNLAVMQFITSDMASYGGAVVSSAPHRWTVPLRIDEAALHDADASRDEILSFDLTQDGDDDDDAHE